MSQKNAKIQKDKLHKSVMSLSDAVDKIAKENNLTDNEIIVAVNLLAGTITPLLHDKVNGKKANRGERKAYVENYKALINRTVT